MNLLYKITVKQRMTGAFVLMFIIFIAFGIFSITEMNRLGELTLTLYEHPLQVSNAALRAGMGVVKIQKSKKDLILSTSSQEIHDAIQAIRSEEEKVCQQLDIIKKQILGTDGKRLAAETADMFSNWKPIINEVTNLVLEGDNNAAIIISKGKGADYAEHLEKKMTELRDYARKKADSFIDEAKRLQYQIYRKTALIIFSAALLFLFVSYLMIKSILSSISLLKDTMSEITRTGNFVKAELKGKNEITEMSDYFNILIQKLQNQFMLRDGLNALNQKLAGDLSYDDIVKKSIRFVSRHSEACIGAIYIYDKADSLCKLKASYAFAEKEYFSGQFRQGEGIVGQVAAEKKPILLKNITREKAVGITGTVSEPPKSIYAVPLLYNEELYGVIELAFFEEIGKTKQELLDEMAKIISTAVYTAFQSDQIKELLEAAQNANEKLTAMNQELRSQSDELQVQSAELRTQKKELETQQIQVEEADRLKSEFLSNMSHELRTPLNSILALSQLMISKGTGKDKEQDAEYLRVIERNGRRLLALINDILDLSKIEAGRMDINLTEFDPVYVVDQVVETAHPLADEKGLQLIVHVEKDIMLLSDEDKIYQILLNLVYNGIKFTDQGEVEINVLKSENNICFSIKDTGIGIASEYIPHIFDEFRQADGSTTRRYEGTGLGLAICQKLAKLLGGDISVESVKEKGSIFRLILPYQLAVNSEQLSVNSEQLAVNSCQLSGKLPANSQKPTANSQQTIFENRLVQVSDLNQHKVSDLNQHKKVSDLNQPVILVIEDNDVAMMQIRSALEESGYTVRPAFGGSEALEWVKQEVPDAVILDLMMPDIDGFQVLEQIRSTSRTAKLPVLVLTAKELTTAERNRLSYNNIQQLILKGSMDRNQLVACVAKLFQKQKEKKYPNISPVPKSESVNFDLSQILESEGLVQVSDLHQRCRSRTILIAEDNPDNLITVTAILDGRGYSFITAVNGKEAVRLAKTSRPGIILMDVNLPVLSGLDAAKQIKSDPELNGIPIIAVTAKAMLGDKEKILISGCDDYLSKPINPDDLIDIVKKNIS